MKHIKKFENLDNHLIPDEYLIAQVIAQIKPLLGSKNRYVGEIHLIKCCTLFSTTHDQISAYIINYKNPVFKPSTFSLYYINGKYFSEFGNVYDILYRTKDLDDAIEHYKIEVEAKKYNL